MIQQGLAAQTYHEALISMCEIIDKQPAFILPAFNTFSAGGSVTNMNTLSPSFHRELITAVGDKGNQGIYTVYFADVRH